MYLRQLSIEHPALANILKLETLVHGLNVIYCPLNQDPATICQVTAAILFGPSEANSDHFRPPTETEWHGSATIQGSSGTRTIERTTDRLHRDTFHFESQQDSFTSVASIHDRLGVELSDCADIYAMVPRERTDVRSLLARAERLAASVDDQGNSDVLDRLRAKVAEHRSRLSRLPVAEQSLTELHRHHDDLQRRLNLLRGSVDRDHLTMYSRRRQLSEDVDNARRRLQDLQSQLRATEAELTARDEERLRASRRAHAEHQQTISDLDSQLARWTTILQEIDQQRDRLQMEFNSHFPGRSPAWANYGNASRDHFNLLERKIRDLHQLADSFARYGYVSHGGWRHLRTEIIPTLRALREEILSLCEELFHHDPTATKEECLHRLGRFFQFHTELRQAIGKLEQIRQALSISDYPQGFNISSLGQYRDGDPSGLAPAPSTAIAADQDRWLIDQPSIGLRDRRQKLQRDIHGVTAELGNFKNELSQLKQTSSVLAEEEIAQLQRELELSERAIRVAREHGEIVQITEDFERELDSAPIRSTSILHAASGLLTRLTCGQYRCLEPTAAGLNVEDSTGVRAEYRQLDQATRDQIHTSIALATANVLSRRGIKFPLILGGLSTELAPQWVSATIDILRQWAAQGHQVIILTDQRDVVRVCRDKAIRVDDLVPVPAISLPERQLVRQEDRPDDYKYWPDYPGPNTGRHSRSQFCLHESDSIDDAPSVDAEIAGALRRIGILCVADLLHTAAFDIGEKLSSHGVHIGTDKVRVWQAESLLSCHVPHLRQYDAQVLVACGITDPDLLRRAEPSELYHRVKVLRETAAGRALLDSGSAFEIQRLTNWIESGVLRPTNSAA